MLHLTFMVSALALASNLYSVADKPQWENIDPATRDWFRSLRSPSGIPCCDFADGSRIEDPDYKENEDGSYEVFIRGQWIHVDRNHVLIGINRVGYAVYWGVPGITYCFMPGAGG